VAVKYVTKTEKTECIFIVSRLHNIKHLILKLTTDRYLIVYSINKLIQD